MKYYICPNKSFLGFLDSLNKEKTAAILCLSYEIDVKKLEKLPNKLVLYFDDVCEVRINAFNKDLTTKIKLFASSLSSEITDMYICCDTLSREIRGPVKQRFSTPSLMPFTVRQAE